MSGWCCKGGLLAFSVGIGLAVLDELFEAEVVRLAGPKGKHDADRRAYRHGHESRQVTLGRSDPFKASQSA